MQEKAGARQTSGEFGPPCIHNLLCSFKEGEIDYHLLKSKTFIFFLESESLLILNKENMIERAVVLLVTFSTCGM